MHLCTHAELIDGKAIAEQIRQELKAEVARAIEAAENTPAVEPLSFFDDVFAQPTPTLEEQRASFDQLLREGVLRP